MEQRMRVLLSSLLFMLVCQIAAAGEYPPSPTPLTPADGATVDTTTPTLSWSSVSGATLYYLLVRDAVTDQDVYSEFVQEISHQIPSGKLLDGRSYTWRLQARNSYGWSQTFSQVFTFYVAAAPAMIPPTAPQNLQATPGNAQVSLTWQLPASSGSSPITGYKVYRGPQVGPLAYLTTTGTSTSYLDTGLTNGNTYQYVVSAVNSIEGPWSAQVIATPQAPTNAPVCGNSVVETGEICDGNAQGCTIGGYSGSQLCNAQCSGFAVCQATQFCGDGAVNGAEQCDDGNTNNGDSCNSGCTVPTPGLAIGDWVEVTATAGVKVRTSPNLIGAAPWTAPIGSRGQIIESGGQSGSYTWWKIRWEYSPTSSGPVQIGYSADAFFKEIQAPPLPPKFLTLPFADPQVRINTGWFYKVDDVHRGIDYLTNDPKGTFDILAAAPGFATRGRDAKYGEYVLIRHPDTDDKGQNFYTLYAHLSDKLDVCNRITVPTAGRTVARGEKLGVSGSTGKSTGVHLHFEVQRGAFASHKTDPYDLYELKGVYGTGYGSNAGARALWTTSPPMLSPAPAPTVTYRTNVVNGQYSDGTWIAVDRDADGDLDGFGYRSMSNKLSTYCKSSSPVLATAPGGATVRKYSSTYLSVCTASAVYRYSSADSDASKAVLSTARTEPYASNNQELTAQC